MRIAAAEYPPVFTPEGTRLPASPEFSLKETLDCGQAFRWRETQSGSFIGVVEKNVCEISQLDNFIFLRGADAESFEKLWRPYFDLDRDYAALQACFRADPILDRAITYAPGLRLLHQPAWETLCSFIISQNNNIPRIKGIIERLCALLGDPLEGELYAFPTPERLASQTVESLAPLRAGFRARYLIDAARMVCDGLLDLDMLKTAPLPQARAALQQVCGVGPKVAECVLLYGCGRLSCFPMDVWMRRVMRQLYPDGLPACAQEYAGIAQQYLFHFARTCPEAFGQADEKSPNKHKKRVMIE